ncbi:MAG: hypothetical protein M1826_001112 [Phylliscum demangeonii]|nr:MAG: hypothetical protein M1826_001112 [Phylliscum demangeonii]
MTARAKSFRAASWAASPRRARHPAVSATAATTVPGSTVLLAPVTAAIVASPAHQTMLHLMEMMVWGGYASLAPAPGPLPTEAQRYWDERLGANQLHAQLDRHQPYTNAVHRPKLRDDAAVPMPCLGVNPFDALGIRPVNLYWEGYYVPVTGEIFPRRLNVEGQSAHARWLGRALRAASAHLNTVRPTGHRTAGIGFTFSGIAGAGSWILFRDLMAAASAQLAHTATSTLVVPLVDSLLERGANIKAHGGDWGPALIAVSCGSEKGLLGWVPAM